MHDLKKYDTFLFDADGTLFDFDKAAANALRIMFEYCGFEYTDDIWEIYREINFQVWDSFEKGEIGVETLRTLRFERLFNKLGVYYDTKDFNEKYLYELGKGESLIDGALDICSDIVSCGKRIYIVTNGFSVVQEARKKHSPLKNYISDFFVSELIGFQKPHTSYFEYVFANIPQFSKEKTLIIGDSLAADIAGGNNVGVDTCWLNIKGVVNNSGIVSTYEITELKEVCKFVSEN